MTNIQAFPLAQDNELLGYGRVFRENGRRRLPKNRKQQIAVAATFLADVMEGHVPSWQLMEALNPSDPAALRVVDANYPGFIRESHSVSDFPHLLGDVLDRMMLARYNEVTPAWRQFTKISRPLRDFRNVKRIAVDGLEGQWESVPEFGPVDHDNLAESKFEYAPDLYAKGIRLSFRSLMNDDLNAFDEIPNRLGRGGRRTQSKFVTGLYVDASGPHASLFDASNTVTGNPVLSVASLGLALQKLMEMTDTDGEPIDVVGVTLVVPPALYVTAQNILNQLTIDVTTVGGTSSQTVRVNNWMVANLQLVVDYYIPQVATTANGSTSWFIFSDPDNGRPAIEFGPLAGFAEPVLYRKMPNTQRVGGGVDEMAGDWSTMATSYKGVVGFGGTRMDKKAVVSSNGSAS